MAEVSKVPESGGRFQVTLTVRTEVMADSMRDALAVTQKMLGASQFKLMRFDVEGIDAPLSPGGGESCSFCGRVTADNCESAADLMVCAYTPSTTAGIGLPSSPDGVS